MRQQDCYGSRFNAYQLPRRYSRTPLVAPSISFPNTPTTIVTTAASAAGRTIICEDPHRASDPASMSVVAILVHEAG